MLDLFFLAFVVIGAFTAQWWFDKNARAAKPPVRTEAEKVRDQLKRYGTLASDRSSPSLDPWMVGHPLLIGRDPGLAVVAPEVPAELHAWFDKTGGVRIIHRFSKSANAIKLERRVTLFQTDKKNRFEPARRTRVGEHALPDMSFPLGERLDKQSLMEVSIAELAKPVNAAAPTANKPVQSAQTSKPADVAAVTPATTTAPSAAPTPPPTPVMARKASEKHPVEYRGRITKAHFVTRSTEDSEAKGEDGQPSLKDFTDFRMEYEDLAGQSQELYGKGLREALHEKGLEVGDAVIITYHGTVPVVDKTGTTTKWRKKKYTAERLT